MGKKKTTNEEKTLLEAIAYFKSLKEKGPDNPKITEALAEKEKQYQDELFYMMSQKASIDRHPEARSVQKKSE